jgi:tetratricopeptide (TPR) repeat protein
MLLHGLAGEVLERRAGADQGAHAAELAHHFGLAGHAMRANALTYSLAAGRAAARLSFDFDARQHFARACDLLSADFELGDTQTRIEALEGRGSAERRLGMWSACEATFEAVLAMSTSSVVRARAREQIAHARERVGDPVGALAAVDGGLAEVSDKETPETLTVYVQLHYVKAVLLYAPGQYRAIQAIGELMLLRARAADRLDLVYRAETVLGWGYMGQGFFEQAVDHFLQALDAAERTSNRGAVAVVRENLGMQYLDSGEFASARYQLDESIAIFRKQAREARAMNALLLLGGVHLAEGEVQLAQQYAELACSLASEEQDRRESDCHELLGRIALMRADWDAAKVQFETALRMHRAARYVPGIVKSATGLGLLYESVGNWSLAQEHYEDAVATVQAADVGPHTIIAHSQLGRLFLRMGDVRCAEHIQRANDTAESIPQSVEFARALLAAAELAVQRGENKAGLDLVERALRTRLTAEMAVEAHSLAAMLHARLHAAAQARAHAADALAGAEPLRAPLLMSAACLARACALAVADVTAAEPMFRAALHHAETAHAPYARGRVLEDWGTALRNVADARADGILEAARQLLPKSADVV